MQNIVLIEKSFMKRDYPNRPIVAVGVVVLKQNNVLLIRRNKPPKSDMWSIPGGAQTLGEKLIETAHREIKEEAGIEIENLTLIDALDFIDHDDGFSLWLVLEQLQNVDEVRTRNWIATNTHTSRLAETVVCGLFNRFIGQGA